MFRNPELLLIETALLLFPMLLLAWMGWRSALSSHSKPKVLAFGLLATVPLCWVLGGWAAQVMAASRHTCRYGGC
jgi:hypothetical protein